MIDSWKTAMAVDSPAVKTSVPINAPGWSIDLPANRLVNGDVESGTMSPWTPFGGARGGIDAAASQRRTQFVDRRAGGHSHRLAVLPPGNEISCDSLD